MPDECGPYNVSIKYDGQEVNGSPFLLNSYPIGEVQLFKIYFILQILFNSLKIQAKKCKLTDAVPKEFVYGKKNNFKVDATQGGGKAKVTCRIRSESER